jgi:hypothetical protein
LQNAGGYTPLLRASGAGHLEIVKCLIENGADMDILTMDTALTAQLWAAKAEQYKVHIKCAHKICWLCLFFPTPSVTVHVLECEGGSVF